MNMENIVYHRRNPEQVRAEVELNDCRMHVFLDRIGDQAHLTVRAPGPNGTPLPEPVSGIRSVTMEQVTFGVTPTTLKCGTPALVGSLPIESVGHIVELLPDPGMGSRPPLPKFRDPLTEQEAPPAEDGEDTLQKVVNDFVLARAELRNAREDLAIAEEELSEARTKVEGLEGAMPDLRATVEKLTGALTVNRNALKLALDEEDPTEGAR